MSSGLTVEEALSNLYRLTDCRCLRSASQPKHSAFCVSDYRTDVDALAEVVARLRGLEK